MRSLRPTGGCRVSARARPTDRYKDSPKTSAGKLESDLARATTLTLTGSPIEMVDPLSAHWILAAG